MNVNVHEAKTHLSRLLRRVAAGEEVIISKAGTPIARLVAIGPQSGKRPLGIDPRIKVPADFNDPLPEDVLADFDS
ncbi:MAG: type II toxin-antitoxin system Phd/YefM family antitoxin [Gemmatimonadota bacterium]